MCCGIIGFWLDLGWILVWILVHHSSHSSHSSLGRSWEAKSNQNQTKSIRNQAKSNQTQAKSSQNRIDIKWKSNQIENKIEAKSKQNLRRYQQNPGNASQFS